MATGRIFKSKITQDSRKVVIVGIDFGTSFTKVYFNQDGEIKEPLKFEVNEKSTFFLPTKLYYDSTNNKLFFKKGDNRKVIKYFKYSMINNDLITSKKLSKKNPSVNPKVELLCSIYFIAFLIKEIKAKISTIIESTDIQYNINMGCPIENFKDKNRAMYDTVLNLGYQLSMSISEDGMTIEELLEFYKRNQNIKHYNLQTIPELYAEALWFIEQPSTGRGIYTILDIGGGTVDFASILVRRDSDGEKHTSVYSQKVIPFGIEVLLQSLYPNEYRKNRKECLRKLKTKILNMPYGYEPQHDNDPELKKAHEFDIQFSSSIGEVKERDRSLMEEQYKTGKLPYYTYGGGADFQWYHSIIRSHNGRFLRAEIPILEKQDVILNDIPNKRLIIAEQLTRSNFPEIDGFPWHFDREVIFSGIDREDDIKNESSFESDYHYELEDKQRAIYGDK